MRRSLSVILFLAGLAAPPALAHGVRVEAELQPPYVRVAASYEGGPALPDASVRVYPPGADAALFQRARTDTQGLFAFLPTDEGAWRVVVTDEQGHRGHVEVAIDAAFLEGKRAPGARVSSTSPIARWALGLALIFGVTGLVFWGKARALLRERGGVR